jgi:predicted O-methyltransferase YrrM
MSVLLGFVARSVAPASRSARRPTRASIRSTSVSVGRRSERLACVISGPARVLRIAENALDAFGAWRRFRRAPTALSEAYEFVASFRYGEVQPAPFQIREEIIGLLERLSEQPPRSIVELGTARGGTLFLLTRVAAHDATLVSVDMADGPFGGGYPRTHAPLLKSFARERQTIHLIRGDTHSPATFDRVRQAVGAPIDLLFIDADHTYEGVRGDYEMYAPLVASGGLIGFHDIVEGPHEAVGDVPRFWREIRPEGAEEIVADWGQGGYGIGLMRLP